MDFTDFTANSDDSQRRLDKVLRKFLDKTSLSELYKLIRKGLIRVNKKKTLPEYRINEGDVISIASFLLDKVKNPVSESSHVDLQKIDFIKQRIVFENEHILIIDKPYDFNVHGDNESLDKFVTLYYNSKIENKSLSFTPGPLHRLDKKTTGLLSFSFSLDGARWFSENIQNHSITKKYYGLIQGKLLKKEEWKDTITNSDEKSNFETVKIAENADEGKYAVTFVEPIAFGIYKGTDITFVKFQIITGRKHQIRFQSSFHNHPLLGDTAYGGKKIEGVLQDFYLQAFELNIPENSIDLPKCISIKPSNEFIAMLKHCGINNIEL